VNLSLHCRSVGGDDAVRNWGKSKPLDSMLLHSILAFPILRFSDINLKVETGIKDGMVSILFSISQKNLLPRLLYL
jgi:hypothetical protein